MIYRQATSFKVISQWQAGKDVPDVLKPVLPDNLPTTPIVIDLQTLRPFAEQFIAKAQPENRTETRNFIFGYDAIVILPKSRKAEWSLTGFETP